MRYNATNMGESKSKTDQTKVQFDSANIKRKPGAEYFVKTQEKFDFKQSFQKILQRLKPSQLFKNANKWVLIAVASVLVLAIIAVILWFTVWLPAIKDERVREAAAAWEAELTSINKEARSILHSDIDNSYTEALKYYDEKIQNIPDPIKQTDLQAARAGFLVANGGAAVGLEDLLAIDELEFNSEQKYTYYNALRFAYYNLGDIENATLYDQKAQELLTDITIQGGF